MVHRFLLVIHRCKCMPSIDSITCSFWITNLSAEAKYFFLVQWTTKYRPSSGTAHWFLLVLPRFKCMPSMKPLSLVVTGKLPKRRNWTFWSRSRANTNVRIRGRAPAVVSLFCKGALIRKRIIDIDSVKDVTCVRQSVVIRMVIRCLWHRGYLLFLGEYQIFFIECDENISKFMSA